METPQNNQTSVGQVTGQAPFYKKPEPLNPQDHGKLGLLRVDNPYSFGETQHFLPLLATEFVVAACSYPIIFAGEEPTPLAVMGVNPGENLFYEDGVLRPDTYIPAYMRRYPFIAASDENSERMVVCIDREAHIVGENAELPFFENGELSQYSKDCIQFCENYETDRSRTQGFVRKLKELDLFEPREANFQPPPPSRDAPPPPPIRVAGYVAVSETKLNALPAETYIELRDLGYLQAIYAHLISQNHWDRLMSLSIARRIKEQASANAKAKN